MVTEREPYVDPRTGHHVLCPICHHPVAWNNKDYLCTNADCTYIGAEALFPEQKRVEQPVGVQHPLPPEQHITLDLNPVSAAFLQRLSRKWVVSPQEAVAILIKKAAEHEFARRPTPQEAPNGPDEVRNPRERAGGQPATDDRSAPSER
jgi:endogenous inhibitor of DNA gyrase (YacG/DUF329 family)